MGKGLRVFAVYLAVAVGAWAQSAVSTYNEANALAKSGQWEPAAQKYEAATQADPNLWQAYMGLGNAYHNLGRDPEALKAYDKSLELHPDNPTLKAYVEKLRGSQSASSSTAATAPSSSNDSSSETGTKGVFMNYSVGYDFAFLDDLVDGSKATAAFANWLFGSTSTVSSPSNSGIATALEFGVMLDENNGISLEPTFVLGFDTTVSSDPDAWMVKYAPHMMGALAKYDLLLPLGPGNSLCLSAGVGWYHAIVDWYYNPDTTADNTAFGAFEGDAFGAALGITEEIDLGGGIALGITAKGRWAKFDKVTSSSLKTTGFFVVDPGTYALVRTDLPFDDDTEAEITYDETQNVDGSTIKYLAIDMSGFEGNISLKFYL